MISLQQQLTWLMSAVLLCCKPVGSEKTSNTAAYRHQLVIIIAGFLLALLRQLALVSSVQISNRQLSVKVLKLDQVRCVTARICICSFAQHSGQR